MDMGEFLDGLYRLLAGGRYKIEIEQVGSETYRIQVRETGADPYGFLVTSQGGTVTHQITDLANRLMPGAK